MLNFLKLKKPKVRFWSTVDGVERTSPILPASKVIPQWFKSSKTDKDNLTWDIQSFKGSIKTCPGLIDYFTKGYVMTMWCDLKIEITPDGWKYRTPNSKFEVQAHANSQYLDYLPEHEKENQKFVLKPVSPWRCKLSKGYSLLQLPLYYDFNEIFTTIPGVLDSDYYHELNIQMIIKKYGEFFIPKGTPLIHYLPIKREDFDFEIIKNSGKTKYWDNVSNTLVFSKFFGSYKDAQKNNSKCPFHKKDEDKL